MDGRKVGVLSLLLVLSFFALSLHAFSPTGFSIAPAVAPAVYSPVSVSFSDPSMETTLQIVSPENGSYKDRSTNSFITLFQMNDTTPIQKIELKVDNDVYVTIPVEKIEIIQKVAAPDSLEVSGRIIRITDRFENKLKPGIDATPGMHKLRARITTTQSPFGMESAEIKYTIMPPSNGPNFSSVFDSKTYYFEGFDGFDCKKKAHRLCTREIIIYLVGSDPGLKEKTENALKDIEPLMTKACVSFKVTYKLLTFPTGTKGYNDGTITDIEDFFHGIHDKGKVTDEDGKNVKDFKKEMGSWSNKGPTPMIVADKVYQDYDTNPSASQHGLTFKNCTAVTKTNKDGKPVSSCNKSLTAYTLVAPASEPGVMAHELGHKFLQEENFNIVEGDVEQHHTIDYKASQSKPSEPLPADNFMRTPVPDGKLGITEKQAGALYEACKDHGGALAMGNGTSSNVCYLITNELTQVVETMCTDGGGGPNAESCWGNSIKQNGRWKAKVPSNFNPNHDVCPEDNDCPVGMVCDVSDCHCKPEEPKITGGPTDQSGPNGSGSSGNGGGVPAESGF